MRIFYHSVFEKYSKEVLISFWLITTLHNSWPHGLERRDMILLNWAETILFLDQYLYGYLDSSYFIAWFFFYCLIPYWFVFILWKGLKIHVSQIFIFVSLSESHGCTFAKSHRCSFSEPNLKENDQLCLMIDFISNTNQNFPKKVKKLSMNSSHLVWSILWKILHNEQSHSTNKHKD